MIEPDTIQCMDCYNAINSLDDESVDVIITDPPYPNGMGLFEHNILDGYASLYACCKKAKNTLVFFWSPMNVPPPPRGWYEVARHVWAKPDAGSRNGYEMIIVWSRDYRRQACRVWNIPILDYRSLKDWKPHPTQKPVKLLRYLLDLYSQEGDLVFDPFVGSGTTAVAAKQLNRRYICTDNDPEYVRIAKERITELQQRRDAAQQETTEATEEPTETPPLTKARLQTKRYPKKTRPTTAQPTTPTAPPATTTEAKETP